MEIHCLADFYTLFGFKFEYHQHGNSPMHYSCTLGNLVLEIYPLSKDQQTVDKNLRLGFSVDNFEYTVELLAKNQVQFQPPKMTEFGYQIVVTDPDGRKVEIYKK
jgi:catechol 2,3-dioxygenase-like lactoylglutathione lyase family enzyme